MRAVLSSMPTYQRKMRTRSRVFTKSIVRVIDMNLWNWTTFTFASLLSVLWASLLNALVGALGGLIVALVYNAVAGIMGGIKIDLE